MMIRLLLYDAIQQGQRPLDLLIYCFTIFFVELYPEADENFTE